VHRPVIAFAPESAGSTLLKGSARSVKGLHIRDVLALVNGRSPGLMQTFGGHAMAAGLSLPHENLEPFRHALEAAVVTTLDGENPEAEVLTDGSLSPDELGMDLAVQIQEYGPWGQRFPEPLFDDRFEILEQRIVGGAHLRMKVRAQGSGNILQAIAFNHVPDDLPRSTSARLLYRLDINRWQGTESCQLMVERIVRET